MSCRFHGYHFEVQRTFFSFVGEQMVKKMKFGSFSLRIFYAIYHASSAVTYVAEEEPGSAGEELEVRTGEKISLHGPYSAQEILFAGLHFKKWGWSWHQ